MVTVYVVKSWYKDAEYCSHYMVESVFKNKESMLQEYGNITDERSLNCLEFEELVNNWNVNFKGILYTYEEMSLKE